MAAVEPFPALKVLDALRATRDLDVNLQGLQDLLKELSSSRAVPSLLSLLQLSPDFKELPEIWDAQLTVKDPKIYTALLRAYAELLLLRGKPPACVLPPPIHRLQQTLSKHVLTRRMKALYFNLTSDHRPRINASLHLLAALARKGAALTRDLVAAFDFKLSALPKLAAPPREKNVPLQRGLLWKRWSYTQLTQRPSRALFVELAVSILSSCDADLLPLILANRVLMGGLLNHLSVDPPPVIYEVLRLLQERVLGPQSRLLPAQRAQAFGDTVLQQLASLSALDKKASLADGAAASDVQQVQELAYQILEGLCTDPSYGLVGKEEEDVSFFEADNEVQIGRQEGRLTSGHRRVLRLLQKIHALEVPSYSRLVMKVTEAQPALAAELLKSNPYDLEPQATARWLSCAAVVQALLTVVGSGWNGVNEVSNRRSDVGSVPSWDTDTCPWINTVHLPACLPKALLSRGVQHADRSVQLSTLRILSAILSNMQPILKLVECHASGSQVTDEATASRTWTQSYRELRALIRSRLPDLQTLLSLTATTALLASAENTGDNTQAKELELIVDSSAGDNAGAADQIDQVVSESGRDGRQGAQQVLATHVLEVVGLYCRWMPEGAADSHFDPNKLLAQDARAFSPAVQVSVLGVLRSHAVSKSQVHQGVDHSSVTTGPFLQLLLLLTASPVLRARQLAKELLAHRLLSLGAFTFNPEEVQVWLTHLPALPLVNEHSPCKEPPPQASRKHSTVARNDTAKEEREVQEDRDDHLDRNGKKKKKKLLKRQREGQEGPDVEEAKKTKKKKKKTVDADDEALLQQAATPALNSSTPSGPWFESTLNFLSEAVVLMARRPVELYTQMQELIAEHTGQDEAGIPPSLLAVAALRQCLKVLKSEKMSSMDKACITGYVAGVLGTLMRQQQGVKSLVTIIRGLLVAEFQTEGGGSLLDLPPEARPLKALWEQGERLYSQSMQWSSAPTEDPSHDKEIHPRKRKKLQDHQVAGIHTAATSNGNNHAVDGHLPGLKLRIHAKEAAVGEVKGANRGRELPLQELVNQATELLYSGQMLPGALLTQLQCSLLCGPTEACISALSALLGSRADGEQDEGLMEVARFTILAHQLSLSQIMGKSSAVCEVSAKKEKKKTKKTAAANGHVLDDAEGSGGDRHDEEREADVLKGKKSKKKARKSDTVAEAGPGDTQPISDAREEGAASEATVGNHVQSNPKWHWAVMAVSLQVMGLDQPPSAPVLGKNVLSGATLSLTHMRTMLLETAQSIPEEERACFALCLLGCLPAAASAEVVNVVFDTVEELILGSRPGTAPPLGGKGLQGRVPSKDRLDGDTSPSSADVGEVCGIAGTVLTTRAMRRSFLVASGCKRPSHAKSAKQDEAESRKLAQQTRDLTTIKLVCRVNSIIARRGAADASVAPHDTAFMVADSAVQGSSRRERLDCSRRLSQRDLEKACVWFADAAVQKLQQHLMKPSSGGVGHVAQVLAAGLELLPTTTLHQVVNEVLLHVQKSARGNSEVLFALLPPLAQVILTNPSIHGSLPSQLVQTLLGHVATLILSPGAQPLESFTELEDALLVFLHHTCHMPGPRTHSVLGEERMSGVKSQFSFAGVDQMSKWRKAGLRGSTAALVDCMPAGFLQHCLREPTFTRSHIAACLVAGRGLHLEAFEREYEALLDDATHFMTQKYGAQKGRRCALALFLPSVEAYLTHVSTPLDRRASSRAGRSHVSNGEQPGPPHVVTDPAERHAAVGLSHILNSCLEPLAAYAARKRKKSPKVKDTQEPAAGLSTSGDGFLKGTSEYRTSSSPRHMAQDDLYPEEVLRCLHEHVVTVLWLGVRLGDQGESPADKALSTGMESSAAKVDGVNQGSGLPFRKAAALKLLDKILPGSGAFSLEESESLPVAGADEQVQLAAALIELILSESNHPDEATALLVARFTRCCSLTLTAVLKANTPQEPTSYLTRLEQLLYRTLQHQVLDGIVAVHTTMSQSSSLNVVLEGLGALAKAVPLYRFDNQSAVYCLNYLLGALLPCPSPPTTNDGSEYDSEKAECTNRDIEDADHATGKQPRRDASGAHPSESESDSEADDKDEDPEQDEEDVSGKTSSDDLESEHFTDDVRNATSLEMNDAGDESEPSSESGSSQSDASEPSLKGSRLHADSVTRGNPDSDMGHPTERMAGTGHSPEDASLHAHHTHEGSVSGCLPTARPVHHPGVLRLAGVALQGFLGHPKFQVCMGGGREGGTATPLPPGVSKLQGIPLDSVFVVVDGCVAADMEAATEAAQKLVGHIDGKDEGDLPPLPALLAALVLTVLDLMDWFSGEGESTAGLAVQALDNDVLLELLQLLMVVYRGSLSEQDRTLFALMLKLDHIIRVKATAGPGKSCSPLDGPLSAAAFAWGSTAQRLFSSCSLGQLWLAYSKERRVSNEEDTPMDVETENEGQAGLSRREVLELQRGTIKEGGGVELVRVALTCVMFPSWCSWEPPVGPSPPNHLGFTTAAVTAAYDPAYVIRHAHAAMRHDLLPAARFVESGLLSLTLRSLAAADEAIRSLAYEVLALFSQALALQDFRARTQIQTLITSLKNAITAPLQRLPTPAAAFAADASLLLLHPESALYATVNQHLLKHEALALTEVALCGRLIHAGTPGTWKQEQLWALRYLWAVCRTEEDAYILRRRFFPQALLALHQSAGIPAMASTLALHAVIQYLQVPLMARHLVKESGLACWLASAVINALNTPHPGRSLEAMSTVAGLALGAVIQQLCVKVPFTPTRPSTHLVQCVAAVVQLSDAVLSGVKYSGCLVQGHDGSHVGRMPLEQLNEHQLLSLLATLLAQRYDPVTAVSLVPPALIHMASQAVHSITNNTRAHVGPGLLHISDTARQGVSSVSMGCSVLRFEAEPIGQAAIVPAELAGEVVERLRNRVEVMNKWLLRLLVGALARK